MNRFSAENDREAVIQGGAGEGNSAAEAAAWRGRADDLARWVLERMVVRGDAYGKYYIDADGRPKSCKRDGVVDHDLIEAHFASDRPGCVIGLYSTGGDDRCLGLLIDLDRHDGDPESHIEQNRTLALSAFDSLKGLGFHPLLIDSNGRGGLHLIVLFTSPVPAGEARRFGRWLVRDWAAFGLPAEPEVFPKQDSIRGRYGNFTRLFGKHYKRPFYSKVWDGSGWRAGQAAIEIILRTHGDPADLLPPEALGYSAPTRGIPAIPAEESPSPGGTDPWWRDYAGDLRTLDILGLFESRNLLVSWSGDRQAQVVCPWAGEHTTGDDRAGVLTADEDEGRFPAFRCFHAHCDGRGLREVLESFGRDEVDAHCRRQFGVARPQVEPQDRPVVSANDPLGAAKTFYEARFRHDGGRTLVRHQGRWFLWDGRRYVEVSDEDLRAQTWDWLASCSCWGKATKSEPRRLAEFVPGRSHVTATLDALQGVANLPGRLEMPCWIGRGGGGASGDIIAFDNGLLDMGRSHEPGDAALMPHTPGWLSTNCLPHRFDPDARCPGWLGFLDQVFQGDAERIRSLAQWFGYNLTGDIRQQKFALFVGPLRSGKGTTMAILSHLLGLANVASPTLTSLGGRFGLAPLVGKQAAILGDAHLGRSSDAVAILERLKSIVGGDAQNVDRKGRDELAHVVLKARFTVSVNELPRLPDASAALRSRMLLIPFEVSFEGREDHDLQGRLLDEIPGITNWALEGLGDLRRSGRFLQPGAGRVVIDDFVRLSSPSRSFVEDCCEVGPGRTVLASHLQCAWQEWCREHGHEAGSMASFGAKLRAAVPGVSRVRQRHEGNLTYVYRGISLSQATMAKVEGRLLCQLD